MNYTSITLGELLSNENETIKRNAISILKQLQKRKENDEMPIYHYGDSYPNFVGKLHDWKNKKIWKNAPKWENNPKQKLQRCPECKKLGTIIDNDGNAKCLLCKESLLPNFNHVKNCNCPDCSSI
jgi:hypothetical protein